MIDHVSLGVADLARSRRFYEATLAVLDYRALIIREHTVGFGKSYPELWINLRSGLAPAGDRGVHVALRATSMAAVDAFHAAALAAGGMDDGRPGLRPEYHARYYATFVVDPDGNRIEVVTFVDAP